MMKVYRVTLEIIDFDGLGGENIIDEIRNTRYSNDCIDPKVIKLESSDIGDWDDNHPLNKKIGNKEYFNKLEFQTEFEW